ncbi:hypothetical protein C804_06515 [Lachnospiraceae bacterium A4]|jgi:hypothetical protein|nr:hypothetical protein C804_06515 [Lachnospiraceae bacterium A4]
MRGKKMLKTLLMLAGLLILIVVMYFAVNLWRLCTFRIGKTLYIDVVDADAEYLEYIYSMRNNSLQSDPNAKLNLLDKKVFVRLIKYMKKNDLKICDGKYVIPQTSTFKELIEILDFEENKNVNNPIP